MSWHIKIVMQCKKITLPWQLAWRVIYLLIISPARTQLCSADAGRYVGPPSIYEGNGNVNVSKGSSAEEDRVIQFQGVFHQVRTPDEILFPLEVKQPQDVSTSPHFTFNPASGHPWKQTSKQDVAVERGPSAKWLLADDKSSTMMTMVLHSPRLQFKMSFPLLLFTHNWQLGPSREVTVWPTYW